MKKLLLGIICLCVIVSAAALFLTGCDEAEGLEIILINPSDKEMTTRENSIWLTASFPGATKQDTDTTNDTSTVDFGDPVDPDDILHLPLEWDVTNPGLGQIFGSAGTSALYVRNSALGVNTIVVRDQYDNEGYATIRQMVEQYRLELTPVSGSSSNNLSAAYIPVGQVTATIRVSSAIGGDGPTAPFTWSVLFPTRGYIQAGQGSDTVVFRATTLSGYNVVQCTDAYGVVGTIVVNIGVDEDDDGGVVTSTDTSLGLAPTLNPIPNGQNQSTITIGNPGTPTYTWTVTPLDVGNTATLTPVSPTTSTSVTLQTNGDGDYQINVTDSAVPARSGQITITQS